ncbi:hypothetical protein ILUMI_10381, partial [Ignelater luminosus]
YKIDIGHFFLRSGTTAWQQPLIYQKYTFDHPVVDIITHEEFGPESLRNDVSLIRVKVSLEIVFGKRIPLASSNYK